ncbi:hypothetical protein SRRS_37770 [Sporomusa rhizae]|uniref:DUF1836 domain-containing protein n=1 Tax=Sporomusa rhizae TaxID=357999 RepID=UPI00352A3DC1
MQFDKSIIHSIIEGLHLTDEIQVKDIPDIGLYMDQLLEFLNRRLSPAKRDILDKGLTKTMINNYTKDQLMIPPENKKYSTYHIMLLILICQLKSILSISDIKKLLAPMLNDIGTPDDDIIPLEEIYNTFLDLKRQQFSEFQESFIDKVKHIESKMSSIDTEQREEAELFLTVLLLTAQANASKRLAEKLIDTYFVGKTE